MPTVTEPVGEGTRVAFWVSRNFQKTGTVSILVSIASPAPISAQTIGESTTERWADCFCISKDVTNGLGGPGEKSGEVALIGTITSWKAAGLNQNLEGGLWVPGMGWTLLQGHGI